MHPIEVDENDYNALFELFKGETDRGAAVLAGSFVENYLGAFLQDRLVDRTMAKKMFALGGSLSTFEQRIDFAQGFGYLPKMVCRELHLIRKLRNHFAHHPRSATFAEAPASDWANALSASKAVKSRTGRSFKLDDAKTAFLISCGVIFVLVQELGTNLSSSAA